LKLFHPIQKPNITQLFGENREYYSDLSQHPGWSFPGHNGLDYAAFVGQPVFAAADGIAHAAFENDGFGNYVWIQHTGTLQTFYGHLIYADIYNNGRVAAGDLIGYAGSTGCSTGPHLHFGLKDTSKRNNAMKGWVDPIQFLPNTEVNNDVTAPIVLDPISYTSKAVLTASILTLRLGSNVEAKEVGKIYAGIKLNITSHIDISDRESWVKTDIEHVNGSVWCAARHDGFDYLSFI